MPEGDTVARTCQRLHHVFAGHTTQEAELRWGNREGNGLIGHTTIEVIPHGKHILHRFSNGWTLHSHLRMEGSWRITHPNEPQRHSHRVRALLSTNKWTALGLSLGMLNLIPTRDEHTLTGHLGPDILGPDWNTDLATTNLLTNPTTIGAALLDQRNLAGIGTLWASETLFTQHINPWTPTTTLTPQQITKILTKAHQLMTAALNHAVQSSTGSHRPGHNTYVHARSGHPCRRCGTTIRVHPIGPPTRERVMFYCPTCQNGLAPGDKGTPIKPLGYTQHPRPSGPRKTRYGR
ncbi:DNA-formamidopyrimidine glycosylase family protein [Dermatophilus congolensis]|uniref:DNA-formamidopyrimidine glycosylase family protein n=1 Tax=Dermatophilus congolensis TaxID=1863 RepID=UPI001AAF8BAC|nr:DNA-formamidopyrimidine glycosylase family protein [Dermatophilus congolensis]MBO3142623.1 Fpg/Nei family DNA glycosylase [Dermatophilus congolensis]MBO3151613.1 Fpg/Nei family DNA glycosylase [Dermatophilus congolensis]MBO3161386.1 Fpg/Nei family DNA glycosylase [Dermatophilus congolensis]MBO3162896.1 Fpg/Nei family DNA glycosylase [Dermatophilus congolensis]MBO3176449.1 Fpg/Nei family DNA glycosylase [Dermatophilus congolensis]